jgi:hypothetical protein
MANLKLKTANGSHFYECLDMDAGLPLHSHQPGLGAEHDIRCERGSLLVYVHPDKHFVMKAGERLEFDSTLWHGVVPLEEGTAFRNTTAQPQEDFESTLNSPHAAPPWVMELVANLRSGGET